MQTFLAKCQAHLARYGCHIAEEVCRSSNSKQRGTEQSRANHFIEWTNKIELNQDPCLPFQDQQARNYLVACYAVSLIKGETIQGGTI